MALAQASGHLYALVRFERWHPDVGEDDVRLVLVHGLEQRVEVAAGRNDLDRRRGRQELLQPLADYQTVLAHRYTNGHAVTIAASERRPPRRLSCALPGAGGRVRRSFSGRRTRR